MHKITGFFLHRCCSENDSVNLWKFAQVVEFFPQDPLYFPTPPVNPLFTGGYFLTAVEKPVESVDNSMWRTLWRKWITLIYVNHCRQGRLPIRACPVYNRYTFGARKAGSAGPTANACSAGLYSLHRWVPLGFVSADWTLMSVSVGESLDSPTVSAQFIKKRAGQTFLM